MIVAARVGQSQGSDSFDFGATPTDSLVERFGLFTIIVLGEVVVGVVEGMGEATLDVVTMATGLFALVIGFGLWWVYFDFVGRRLPQSGLSVFIRWIMSHLPITLAIAAAGASMVGLIHHAHDEATPAATAWLLSGSVAIVLLSLTVTVRTLADYERFVSVYRPITWALAVGAVAALVVGWLQPTPWLLALLLVVILSLVWIVAVDRWLRIREEVLAAEASTVPTDTDEGRSTIA